MRCKACTSSLVCTECADSHLEVEQIQRIVEEECICPSERFYDNIIQTVPCVPCKNDRCVTCVDSSTCETCVGTTLES